MAIARDGRWWAITPAQIAEMVAQAIREDRFYIFPHPERKADVAARMEDILEERVPVFPPRVKSITPAQQPQRSRGWKPAGRGGTKLRLC